MKFSKLIVIGICLLSAYYVESSFAQTGANTDFIGQNDISISSDITCYNISANTDSDPDYINYCQLIREKIKENLRTGYSPRYNRGDVFLSFTLNPDGSLIDFGIDSARSTKNKELIGIVTRGLKKSSPFPPFPASLENYPIPFSVTISFKER